MNKISEWILAGKFSSGFTLLEKKIIRKTNKSIAVEAKNMSGGTIVVWLPISQILEVENDVYDSRFGLSFILIPHWLVQSKLNIGLDLL